MKLIIILIIMGIATANSSDDSNDNEVTSKRESDNNLTTSEGRRFLRPVFPRIGQKFIVTTKSPDSTIVTTPANRLSVRRVFTITPKAVKMKTNNYWMTSTTRPSLMRNIKFTVNPQTNIYKRSMNQQLDKDEDIERTIKINKFRETIIAAKKDDGSEESIETSTAKEKVTGEEKRFKTLLNGLRKLGSSKQNTREFITKFKKNYNKHAAKKVTVHKIKPSEADLSSEEKDKNEFIFVTPKTKVVKEHSVELTDDSDESNESTTTIEKDAKLRRKRSNNVIEEENLGTTVSGFKFTGKINSLSNDLVFRNINT